MGIDLSEIPDEKWLEVLGDGDWHLTLPENFPDLVITREWRDKLAEYVACQFVRWVIQGIRIDINHDDDPPWDHSGEAESYKVNPYELLDEYMLIDSWLEYAYSGNRYPTFESGWGWRWRNYDEEIMEVITEDLFTLIGEQVIPQVAETENEADETIDKIAEVTFYFEYLLRKYVGLMSTDEAWEQFEGVVRIQLAEEKRKREEAQARISAMRQLTRDFWEQFFPDLVDVRIEKPQFGSMNLSKRFADVFADTDPEILRAIAEIGLPGKFSNTVGPIIQELAKSALRD